MARALHQQGELAALVTDFWFPPNRRARQLPGMRRLRERWHPELADARILAPNASMLVCELKNKLMSRLTGRTNWEVNMSRNAFFQHRAVELLSRFKDQQMALFSYSYAAADLIKFAKARNWATVLGQIDPGPEEERIVGEVSRRHGVSFSPAPREYWGGWKQEAELADCIMVNSVWSQQCLLKEGIAEGKMAVVPLAYGAGISRNGPGAGVQKTYPETFTKDRPLRVLFLGQINVRKGVVELLQAAQLLQDEPVEIVLVGGVTDRLCLAGIPRNVRLTGPVERGQAARYYQEADVFILPTHSDGFALTQLEAQAHGLPVIASKHCGDVVKDGLNGLLLPELTPDAVVSAVRSLLQDPSRLVSMARESRVGREFLPEATGEAMASLVEVRGTQSKP